jgi:hypothetical protein
VQRGIIQRMIGNNKIVAEQVAKVRRDLRDLWTALRHDPKKQARKERAWSLLSGALMAATTMAARQAATKIWTRLTGEVPPPVHEAEKEAAKLRKEMSA